MTRYYPFLAHEVEKMLFFSVSHGINSSADKHARLQPWDACPMTGMSSTGDVASAQFRKDATIPLAFRETRWVSPLHGCADALRQSSVQTRANWLLAICSDCVQELVKLSGGGVGGSQCLEDSRSGGRWAK